MATHARAAQRKTRWSTPPPRPSSGTHPQPYRRRRPETTTLHRIVREHLETYLALASCSDPMGPVGDGVPDHVEREFRSYLKCGILAHGFARARCATCGFDFLVAFSCKGRGACPSCNAKRMAETAAHLVDHVFPHVPVRQWVLSVPKRLRPFLHHRPRTASAVLHILLRALHTTLREACPTAPQAAAMGAVSFLHRFGSSLNPHFHFHLCVVDGLFERLECDADQDPATPATHLRFHEATALTHELLEGLQHTVRSRVLRHFRRHGLLEPYEAEDMLAWDHGGGFSLDARVRIEATDRPGLERLIRYCARPPFALERLHLVGDRSDQILYLLPGPDLAGRTALRLSALEFLDRLATILPPPRIHRHRYHGVFAPNAPLRPLVTARTQEDNALAAEVAGLDALPPAAPEVPSPQPEKANRKAPDTTLSRPSRWAALLARIYEVFPLICPACQTPLTFIAFLTDPEPVAQILAHIGEPTSPPPLHPARGPPQTEFSMGPGAAKPDEAAQESFPDDLNQSPTFDPSEPEPIPEDDFDQSWGA